MEFAPTLVVGGGILSNYVVVFWWSLGAFLGVRALVEEFHTAAANLGSNGALTRGIIIS